MWWALAGLVFLIVQDVGIYLIGKHNGKTEEQKKTAEVQAADMARNADIASKPTPERPLSSMLPR